MDALSTRVPDRRLGLGLIRRGLTLWILGRVALIALGIALTGTLPSTLFARPRPSVSLALIAAVGALGLLETRRLHEHRFLANLGVSPAIVVLMLTLPAVAAEILIAALA